MIYLHVYTHLVLFFMYRYKESFAMLAQDPLNPHDCPTHPSPFKACKFSAAGNGLNVQLGAGGFATAADSF